MTFSFSHTSTTGNLYNVQFHSSELGSPRALSAAATCSHLVAPLPAGPKSAVGSPFAPIRQPGVSALPDELSPSPLQADIQ